MDFFSSKKNHVGSFRLKAAPGYRMLSAGSGAWLGELLFGGVSFPV